MTDSHSAKRKSRWWHPTLAKLLLVYLVGLCLLRVADRYWLFGMRRGMTENVKIGVALGIGILLVWLLGAAVCRRRPQFSIAAMMILAVDISVLCAWHASCVRLEERQEHAMHAILDVHARITKGKPHRQIRDHYEAPFNRSTDPRIAVTFEVEEDIGCGCCYNTTASHLCNDDLRPLACLYRLQSLNMPQGGITDDGLTHLREQRELRHLVLSQNEITDAGLAHIRRLTDLERLDLSGTQVTNAGLTHLVGMKNIEFLCLSGTRVTDLSTLASCRKLADAGRLSLDAEGVNSLNHLRALTRLNVGVPEDAPGGRIDLHDLSGLTTLVLTGAAEVEQTRISNLPALTSMTLRAPTSLRLSNLPNLTFVHILGRISADHCRQLGSLPKLQRLTVAMEAGSDPNALLALGHRPNIERLSLSGDGLTDESLDVLRQLPELRVLQLQKANLTPAALDSAQELERLRELSISRIVFTESPLVLSGFSSLGKITISYLTLDTLRIHPMPSLNSLLIGGANSLEHPGGIRGIEVIDFPELLFFLELGGRVRRLTLRGSATDENLAMVDKWGHIEEFVLEGEEISNLGFEHLRELSRLKRLDISDTSIAAEGFSEEECLQRIEELTLAGVDTSRVGASPLRGCTFYLNFLDLSNTPTSDKMIDVLLRLRGLREVNLSGTNVTEAAVQKLREECPKLNVTWP